MDVDYVLVLILKNKKKQYNYYAEKFKEKLKEQREEQKNNIIITLKSLKRN